MWMVVLFIRQIFHWPVAGHWCISGADERIGIRARDVLEEVLREEGAIDLDSQAVLETGDLDTALGPGGRVLHSRLATGGKEGEGGQSKLKANRKHG